MGDETADFAYGKGFKKVLTASGTSQDLVQLIMKSLYPKEGVLWYLSGEKIKGNLVEDLNAAGFDIKRYIVYSIVDAVNLPLKLCDDIKKSFISHVIFSSARTTEVFINLLRQQKLEGEAARMTALCLSQRIKHVALSLKWQNVWVSLHPTIKNLMEYFNERK